MRTLFFRDQYSKIDLAKCEEWSENKCISKCTHIQALASIA